MFTDAFGQPLCGATVTRQLLAKAGVPPLRFHDLRHTAASLLLRHGESLFDVSRWLGHSTIAVTADVYGHLVPNQLRRIARRLDDVLGAS